MRWTISSRRFEGLDVDSLRLLIKDAQSRIDSNPRDRNYVSMQSDFIRLAKKAIKEKEAK